MIQITQKPDTIHLSHQDAVIKVKTDEHISGNRAVVNWNCYFYEFSSYPSPAAFDEKLYIKILGEEFEIMCDENGIVPLSQPGKQIYPYWSEHFTAEEWFEHFWEMLNLNPYLSKTYNIILGDEISSAPGGYEITFQAKEYGDIVPDTAITSYSSEGVYNVWSTASSGYFSVTDGTEVTYDDGIHIGLEILDENEDPITSDPWWRVPMLANLADYDGVSQWEISHVLQAKLALQQLGFDTEYLAGHAYKRHRNHYKYKLRATVQLSDESTVTTTSGWIYCFFGKPSWYKQAIWNETGGSFYNDIISGGRFLTQQPQQKKIRWKAPEWLYFINPYNNADCTIEVKCYYNDGSETTKTIGPFEAYPYDTWQIDVSPTALQLTGTPIRFEVYVKIHDNVIDTDYTTETRIYDIDYKAYPHDRVYIFRNHYGGGFDTMRATGMIKATGKIERESMKKQLPNGYTLKDREYCLIDSEFNAEFELNWGFLQQYGGDIQEWIQYMRQLELSDMAFEYMDGQVFPCEFTTEKWTMWDDEKPNPDHVSTFRRAYVDKGHANDPIELAPDYNDDFNEDYLT